MKSHSVPKGICRSVNIEGSVILRNRGTGTALISSPKFTFQLLTQSMHVNRHVQALVQRLTSPESPDLLPSPPPRNSRRSRGGSAASPSASLRNSNSADWQPSPSNLGKERNPKEEAEPSRTWLEEGVEPAQIPDGGKRRREAGWREPGRTDGGTGGVEREGALTPHTPFFERDMALPARTGTGREEDREARQKEVTRQRGASAESSDWGALPPGQEDAEADSASGQQQRALDLRFGQTRRDFRSPTSTADAGAGMRGSMPGTGPTWGREPVQNNAQIPYSPVAPGDVGTASLTPTVGRTPFPTYAQVLSSRDGKPLAKGREWKGTSQSPAGSSENMFRGLGTSMEGANMEREGLGSMRGSTRPSPLSIAQRNAYPRLPPRVLGRTDGGPRDSEWRGDEAGRQEGGSPLSIVQNTALTLGSPGSVGATPTGLGSAVWRREGLGVITPPPSYVVGRQHGQVERGGGGGGGGQWGDRVGRSGEHSLPECEEAHDEERRRPEEAREEAEEGDDSGKPALLDLFL